MTNHYLILGVKEFSSIELVKKQYRKLVKIYHPDKNPNNRSAEDRFKQLAHSYSILSNPTKKKEHDAILEGKTYQSKGLSYEDRVEAAKRKRAIYKRFEIETRYKLYQNSIFNIRRRMYTAIFAMSGIFTFFILNYFPNYDDSSNLISLAFSGLVFAGFIYLLVDAYYIKLAFSLLKRNKPTDNAIKFSSYLFILVFFASPLLGSMTANIRRVTLLNYNTSLAKPLEITQNHIENIWTIRFYANYKSYSCKFDASDFEKANLENIIILYYPGDPRLCKISKKSLK